MTKKTIEMIEEVGYKLGTVKIDNIRMKDEYYFTPCILEGKHYAILVKCNRKTNDYNLYQIITDGHGNEYKSCLIDDVRSTNTFKACLRKLIKEEAI